MGNVQPTRILCLGDSLTEGMSSPRPGKEDNPAHPYSAQLHKHLSMPLDVRNAGHSGFTATQVFDTLEEELKRTDVPYDVMLIMAGTNDLLTQSPDYILGTLQKIWKRACDSGCKIVVALPVLEVTFDPTMMACQKQLNKQMKQLFESRSQQPETEEKTGQGRLHYYDICSAFPQDALGDTDKILYWSDPVHPTAEGYDRIAELIGGSFLEPLLTSDFHWTTGRDEALRKAFTDNKASFVERMAKQTGFPAAEIESRLAALGRLAR